MSEDESNSEQGSATKDQHFVPKFYLKRFADTQNFLQVLDIKNRALRPRRSYAGVCYSPYFYAAKTGTADETSQEIEQWLQRIEDWIAKRLSRIIEKILKNEQITDSDKYLISVLCSMLWLRGPAMRNQMHKIQESVVKQMFGMHSKLMVESYNRETNASWSDEQKGDLEKLMHDSEYSLDIGNSSHLQLMVESLGLGGEGFANMFFCKRWRFYIARGKRRFITSDNPVAEWSPPMRGIFGRSFTEREHFLALTPEILLECTYPAGGKLLKRQTLFADEDDVVMMYNMVIAGHSTEFAYSSDRAQLSELLNGLANPGAAQQMYFDRFVRPHHSLPSA